MHTMASRILRFPLTRLILAVVFATAPVVLLQIPLTKWHLDHTWLVLPMGALAAVFSGAGYVAYVRLIEQRAPAELAFAGALGELGRGAIVGVLLFTTTIGILGAAGVYTVGGVNPISVLSYPLAGSIVSGVFEEILFRGILFRLVEESLGTWLALLVSAVVFGLAHLANPGSSVVGAASIIIEAGILLAGAYMLTRRLWMPIGLHFAWNFTEPGIFGADVSGHHVDGLLRSKLTGPAWLTGGTFGPEASVIAVALCLAASIAFIAAAVRRGHVVEPMWRRCRPEPEGAPA